MVVCQYPSISGKGQSGSPNLARFSPEPLCFKKKNNPKKQKKEKDIIFGGFESGTQPHELKNLFHAGLHRTIVLCTEN